MKPISPALRLVEKELYVYFKTYYTDATEVILFPLLLVWTIGLGLGKEVVIQSIPYIRFIAPGIILMSVIATAFFHTGFIMLFEKEYQGSFEGVITCPISIMQLTLGKILSGSIKSMINGIIIIIVLSVAIGYMPPWPVLLSPLILFAAGVFFSAVGIMFGVVLKRGYHLGTIGNIVILPPTFIGGIFYDINELPPDIAFIAKLSPVTMMISGLRKLMVYGDANIAMELVVCFSCSILLFLLATKIVEKEVIK